MCVPPWVVRACICNKTQTEVRDISFLSRKAFFISFVSFVSFTESLSFISFLLLLFHLFLSLSIGREGRERQIERETDSERDLAGLSLSLALSFSLSLSLSHWPSRKLLLLTGRLRHLVTFALRRMLKMARGGYFASEHLQSAPQPST